MFKTGLKKNKAGANMIVIAVVVVLIVAAAGVGVWMMTKNGGNPSDDPATFDNPGMGTTMKYNVESVDVSMGKGTLQLEILAENTTQLVVHSVMVLTGTADGASVTTVADSIDLGSNVVVLPKDAVFVEKETMSTCDGNVEVNKYTSVEENGTYWVGDQDSGKKNLAIYKMSANNEDSVYVMTLVSYDLKSHAKYTPSDIIGTSYGQYRSADSTNVITAKYVAESSKYNCVEFVDSFGVDSNVYVLLEKSSNKPYGYVDKSTKDVEIGGETFTLEMYELTSMSMTSGDVVGMSSTSVLGLYDGYIYQFGTKVKFVNMDSEIYYNIDLE